MLRVVEVGRNTHYNIPYLLTQMGLSGFLHEEFDETLITDHLGILLGSIFVNVEGEYVPDTIDI